MLTTTIVATVLDKPLIQWQQFIDELLDVKPGTAQRDVRDLDAAIETLCRFRAYLDSRANGLNHSRARTAQNRLATKVRRALGYSIPKQEIYF